MEDPVVDIELPEGSRGWVVSDSAVGPGATAVVVAMGRKRVLQTPAALMTKGMPMCSS